MAGVSQSGSGHASHSASAPTSPNLAPCHTYVFLFLLLLFIPTQSFPPPLSILLLLFLLLLLLFPKDYPGNTVKGRICLGQRLDWDRDTTKETSDIYIKPRWANYCVTIRYIICLTSCTGYIAVISRLIVIAITVIWVCIMLSMIYK